MSKVQESGEVPQTRWYKSIWFLTLLNAIGGVVGFWGSAMLLRNTGYYLPANMSLYCALLGMINGGILGYTLWASTDDFPQSSIVLMGGLWATALGGMFLDPRGIICTGILFPLIACVITFVLIRKGSSIGNVLIAGMILAVLIYLVIDSGSLSHMNHLLTIGLIGGGLYGLVLSYLLQRSTLRERTAQQALELHNRQRDELASGLLPEGTFIVGDDGELVEINENETQLRGIIS